MVYGHIFLTIDITIMNNEKSNRPMSVRESIVFGSEVLRDCDEKIYGMVTRLNETSVVGNIAPVLQHLEEAAYWIRKCVTAQDKYILETGHD